jgi:hypothetical protein
MSFGNDLLWASITKEVDLPHYVGFALLTAIRVVEKATKSSRRGGRTLVAAFPKRPR